MLFKLSNLNSNLALTLGYLNPALNNSAQIIIHHFSKAVTTISSSQESAISRVENEPLGRF